MRLYTYFRSSAAYRVRIALNLKGIACEAVPVHLTRSGGEHLLPAYRALNPQALVPVLEDKGTVIAQSLAIIEYLDETHPDPRLLPGGPAERARIRAAALAIACDVQPLNNLRVLNYLRRTMGQDKAAVTAWSRHWIEEGFRALEAGLGGAGRKGEYSFGERPTLADVCLVPQMYNARRYECDLSPYPVLCRIDAACRALPAFAKAAPEAQPDAE